MVVVENYIKEVGILVKSYKEMADDIIKAAEAIKRGGMPTPGDLGLDNTVINPGDGLTDYAACMRAAYLVAGWCVMDVK